MGGSYGSDRRFDPGKPGHRIATDWVTAGSLNQTDLLVCARSLHRSGDRVRWRVPQVVWRGMGLNVQSGHSKVAVQACGPSFSTSTSLLLLLLQTAVSSSSAFPPHSPAISRPSYAGGASLPGRSAHSVFSFLLCLSPSPRLSFLSFFSFTGQEREVLLGPWAPLAVLDPSATLLSVPGLWGSWGARHGFALSSLSLFHDGLGRASGREGGWTLCCLCPTRPHPSPF